MVCEKCGFIRIFLSYLLNYFLKLLIVISSRYYHQSSNFDLFLGGFSGEKKLSKVIVPDKWKEGASNTTEAGGRKINENKLLSKKKR